jgi:FkbM family methyltransferase
MKSNGLDERNEVFPEAGERSRLTYKNGGKYQMRLSAKSALKKILLQTVWQAAKRLPSSERLVLVEKLFRDLSACPATRENPHVFKTIVHAFFETKLSLLGGDGPFHMGYSQCGEDLIVSYIFRSRGLKQPTYLDIGAHDPLLFSNTALFYAMGSCGVNVEANPNLIEAFRLKRPRDKNICCAVTEKTGPCTLVVPDEGETLASVATLESESREWPQGRRVAVPGRCLWEILDEYCAGSFPDFLSLDVEGMDFQILQQIPFECTKPKVICVETISYSTTGHGAKDENIARFLTNNGYLVYADTNVNTIFVLRDFWQIDEAIC